MVTFLNTAERTPADPHDCVTFCNSSSLLILDKKIIIFKLLHAMVWNLVTFVALATWRKEKKQKNGSKNFFFGRGGLQISYYEVVFDNV